MKIKKYNLIYFFYLLIISSSVHADYLMGVEAYKNKNYALAFEHWSKSDEQDNLLSQFYLALLYKNALGVERDYKKAFNLFKKTSDQGLLEGKSYWYHPNGSLAWEENYSKGKPNGKFLYFDDGGDLRIEKNYKNGKEISYVFDGKEMKKN